MEPTTFLTPNRAAPATGTTSIAAPTSPVNIVPSVTATETATANSDTQTQARTDENLNNYKSIPQQKHLTTVKNREFILAVLLIIQEVMKFDEIKGARHENRLWRIAMDAFFHHCSIGKEFKTFKSKDRPERNFKSLVVDKIWPNMVNECQLTPIGLLDRTQILAVQQCEAYQRYLFRIAHTSVGSLEQAQEQAKKGAECRLIPTTNSTKVRNKCITPGVAAVVLAAAGKIREHLRLENVQSLLNGSRTSRAVHVVPTAAEAAAAAEAQPIPEATTQTTPMSPSPPSPSVPTLQMGQSAAATHTGQISHQQRQPQSLFHSDPSHVLLEQSYRKLQKLHQKIGYSSDSSSEEEQEAENDNIAVGHHQSQQLCGKRKHNKSNSKNKHQKKIRTAAIGKDCIDVNIGGTIFSTPKKTLCLHSTYFRNKYADTVAAAVPTDNPRSQATPQQQQHQSFKNTTASTYNGGEDNNGNDENKSSPPSTLFIHQDPKPFDVLWKFMRDGYIYSSDITHGVLAQAEFFGMTKLVQAIKCAYRPMKFMMKDDDTIQAFGSACGSSVDEVTKSFDRAYGGSILAALQRGIIPNKFVPKEYAQLVIDKGQILVSKDYRNRADGDDVGLDKTLFSLYAYVEAPAYLDESPRNSSPLLKKIGGDKYDCCSTFLESMNWLHLHGFISRERKYERSSSKCEHLWFSRNADKSSLSYIMKDCPIIIADSHDGYNNCQGNDTNLRSQQQHQRRQFAAYFRNERTGEKYVLADIGMEEKLQFLQGEEQKEGDDSGQNKNIVVNSKITRVETNEPSSWLLDRGYTQREVGIGEIMERIHLHAADAMKEEDHTKFSLQVYSRKLEE